MKGVDVIRMRYVTRLACLLAGRGAPVERYLGQAHIPSGLLERPEAIISAQSMMRFMERAIEDTGWFLLGYEAGSMSLAEHGPVGISILRAPSLYLATQRLIAGAKRETSITDDYLAFEGGLAWICRTPVVGTPVQKQQVELYNLHIVIQMVRQALGADWLPERVKLTASDERLLAGHPELGRLNIEFGASTAAVALPMEKLAMPMRHAGVVATQAGASETGLEEELLTLDTMNALRRLIETYLPYHPTLETLSRLTGISKRSLQRLLQARGSSFSQLLRQVMFNRALQLLGDPGIPLGEIASSLGYSDAAHFSRAFSRMAGLPPSTYREKAQALQQAGSGQETPAPPTCQSP